MTARAGAAGETGLEVGLAALRDDVDALATMTRDSAGPGERASAQWIAARLQAGGVADVAVQPFPGRTTYAHAVAAHALAGLVASAVGGRAGALLAAGTAASLERDVSGRRAATGPPARRPRVPTRHTPHGEGANVVARIPAARTRRRTLVLVAHHDAARGAWLWRSPLARASARRARARGRTDPYMGPVGAALAAVGGAGLLGRAGTPLRAGGAALLATAAALQVDNARAATVPGASDNATGVAAVIGLAERIAARPFADAETLAVLTGCEESGMDGMAAFLAAHAGELAPATTLVLGLDTLGAGTPIVCDAEGALLTHRYRMIDLALADRGAALAGEAAPRRWRIGGWTDPVLARRANLPAISLLSMGPEGAFTNYHVATDTPDRVDWNSVGHCVAIAGGIARAFAGR